MDANDTKLSVAEEIGVVETTESFEETFNTTRRLGTNAIPIAPSMSQRVAELFKGTQETYKSYHDDWKRAITTFVKEGSMEDFLETGVAKENFVRQIVQSLLDLTYMRNPTVEVSSTNAENTEFAEALDQIIEAVINKTGAHSLNLRRYVQRMIVAGHLTNYGIMKLVYTPEKGSAEDTLLLFQQTQKKLKETTDLSDAAHLYALLDRLTEEMNNRRPMGLTLKNVSPFMFYVDPDCTKDDLSDAKFTFEVDFLAEGLIKSEYMTFDEDEQKWRFRYDANVEYDGETRTGNRTALSAKETLVAELMPDIDDKEREYKQKGTIPCVWMHDRVTKLRYLYIMDRWDTPLWVDGDELQLSRFFPYFVLAFSASVSGIVRRSEVSYYLSHQVEVNNTNSQASKIRNAAFSTILYDSTKIDSKEVVKVLEQIQKPSTVLRSIGVKLTDPEAKLENVFVPFMMPVAKMPELFQDPRNRSAIDKAARISAAARGQEFRTNTTNEAIAQYQEASNASTGTLTDIIEDTVSQILWSIAEVVVSKYSKEYVTKIVGAAAASMFQNMSVQEFNSTYVMDIEAGSSEKPTSENKKKEALQIIQMLGQFGKAAPMTIITIVSRMLRKVFSRTLVSDQDLQMLQQEGTAAMQKGVSTANDQPTAQGNA